LARAARNWSNISAKEVSSSRSLRDNRGLWPMYRLMAGAHRYAIDYIEQAPVIVLAAAHGNARVSRSERAFIQEQFSLILMN